MAQRGLRRPRRRRVGLRGRVARRRRTPRGQPGRGRPAGVPDLARRHDRRAARRDGRARRAAASSTPRPTTRSAARRAARARRRSATTSVRGRTRSTAWARSPPRPCSACTPIGTASTPCLPDRVVPAPARDRPPSVDLALPRRLRPDARRGPDRRRPPDYAVLYGISANTRRWWDLEPGRRLGYDPVDDAEEFADRRLRPARRRRGGSPRRWTVRGTGVLPAGARPSLRASLPPATGDFGPIARQRHQPATRPPQRVTTACALVPLLVGCARRTPSHADRWESRPRSGSPPGEARPGGAWVRVTRGAHRRCDTDDPVLSDRAWQAVLPTDRPATHLTAARVRDGGCRLFPTTSGLRGGPG